MTMEAVCARALTVAPTVAALDLEPVMAQLEARGHPRPWTVAQCELLEAWYRRFLTLQLLYPDEPWAPTKEIDEVWHQHILGTRKYAADCDAVFGHFLHHDVFAPDDPPVGYENATAITREGLERFGGSLDELVIAFASEGRSLASLIRD